LAYQATINKPGVVKAKRTTLRLHLLPEFGKRRLDQIDERSIDAYVIKKLEHMTVRGTTLQPATINKQLKLLGRIFRVAHKWKLLRELPEITLLKERKCDFDFLDFDEAEAFLAGVLEHRPRWYPYMLVAMRTGLRVGEMVALRWRDIDLDRGRLHVRRAWSSKTKTFETTKNDKTRELPLTADAVEALRIQQGYVDGELVFAREDGRHHTQSSTQYAINKVTEAIDMRHIHNHVFRHSFASQAAMRGIPMRQIQAWLGHSSIVVTMRYAHLAEGIGDELIQRLNSTPVGQRGTSGARLGHTESTHGSTGPKSAPHTPVRR